MSKLMDVCPPFDYLYVLFIRHSQMSAAWGQRAVKVINILLFVHFARMSAVRRKSTVARLQSQAVRKHFYFTRTDYFK